MPAIYASLTVFLLFGAVSVAIYAAIYGSNRPFDDRITDMGVKMRVAYGNPENMDMDSDSFANGRTATESGTFLYTQLSRWTGPRK